MFHQRAGKPTRIGAGGRMACLAGHAGRQMVNRFGFRRHPSENLAVVATCATADDAGMGHHTGSGPEPGAMAGRTDLRGRQMPDRRGGQVGHQEGGRRGMAGRAIRACRHVRCGRITLLFGRDADRKGLPGMTQRTIIHDARVVHHGRRGRYHKGREVARRMAKFARHIGRQVVHRFGPGRDTDKDLTVVAVRTTGDDAGVVHLARYKVGLVVAQRACLVRRQVVRRHQAAGSKLFPIRSLVAAVA